jgi:hypothetical protein
MDPVWRQHLDHQAAASIARQPELARLHDRLVGLGGSAAWFAGPDPDLAALLAHGRVFAGAARMQPGWPGACHANAAQRWQTTPTTLDLVTGYALGMDGCWQAHSWLQGPRGARPALIETTVRRRLYFGRVLPPAEARAFAATWAGDGDPAEAGLGADLVGVRLLVGPANFAAVAAQQDLPPALVARAAQTAADLEAEIAARYPDPHDALTVCLVNAHLLLGVARFAAVAGQIGMPPAGIAEIAAIARQQAAAGG